MTIRGCGRGVLGRVVGNRGQQEGVGQRAGELLGDEWVRQQRVVGGLAGDRPDQPEPARPLRRVQVELFGDRRVRTPGHPAGLALQEVTVDLDPDDPVQVLDQRVISAGVSGGLIVARPLGGNHRGPGDAGFQDSPSGTLMP